MTTDPASRSSNQISNPNRKQNTLSEDHSTKTNYQHERKYGFLDDKIVLPEDFAELDLEIEKLFYGED
jgi:hypothetical protein